MSANEIGQGMHRAGTGAAIIGSGAIPASDAPKPFVGLVPLEEQNANLLAGRDNEVRVLTTVLRAARLTLVYGASGAGKSSLLRAGVIAELHKLSKEELNSFGTPSFAVAIMNTWAGDPFVQIAESVRAGLKHALDVETVPPLAVKPDLVETLREWTNSFGLELLIILDQFEEFFLYHDSEEGPGTFAYDFPRAVNTADLRVRFLLSMRDDSLFRLDRFQNSLPTLFENRLQVFPLTMDNSRLAIAKAITAYNESQPIESQVEVEPELVTAVLEQVRTDSLGQRQESHDQSQPQPAAQSTPRSPAECYVDAPFMQLVMYRLWDEEVAGWQKASAPKRVMRLATLTRLGGAQAVVQQHLARVMQDFSTKEQKIASDCFYRLVTPGGSKYALTPEELEKWAHHPADEIRSLLEKLVDNKYRIMRRVDKKVLDGIQTAYEAHHDRLARAMLDWQRDYYARQRARRFQLIVGGVMVLGLILALAAGYVQQQRASRVVAKQQKEIEAQQKELKKTEETAETAEETDRAKLANLKALVPKFSCKNVPERSREEIDKINKLLQIDCTLYHDAVANPDEVLSSPRIYFEIQTDDQKPFAQELRGWLLAQKFNGRTPIVPGIENVGPRNLRTSQLRYFHDNSSEANWAWLIVNALKNVCVDIPSPQLVKGYEDSTAIRPLHFELWLTLDALDNLGCNRVSAK